MAPGLPLLSKSHTAANRDGSSPCFCAAWVASPQWGAAAPVPRCSGGRYVVALEPSSSPTHGGVAAITSSPPGASYAGVRNARGPRGVSLRPGGPHQLLETD